MTSESRPIWTEGICGGGAAILRDGVMQPIEEVIAALNAVYADMYWPRETCARDLEVGTMCEDS